ncbi:hypothetical protein D8674_037123 [Pyrus ussuriensis x Pyrus communis]|uniref:Uncharacterized protein n=1 Tax=Pyrus ussuriensis x Pyrus communis TaxID=2448454 RepID=A0A5N5FNY5_9ROSA|nr:hypothetical protein D8674_037123 [Pyrus ussuriensis x Pyrus communis]
MLVPRLAKNLLSVGQRIEHGFFLLFGEYMVDIFYDRSLNNLVVSVKQRGNKCFPHVFKSGNQIALSANMAHN